MRRSANYNLHFILTKQTQVQHFRAEAFHFFLWRHFSSVLFNKETFSYNGLYPQLKSMVQIPSIHIPGTKRVSRFKRSLQKAFWASRGQFKPQEFSFPCASKLIYWVQSQWDSNETSPQSITNAWTIEVSVIHTIMTVGCSLTTQPRTWTATW